MGAIMILTLKLISLAACYQDSFVKDRSKLTPYQQEHLLSKLPSPLAYVSFVFGVGNLLAGPTVEFTEYDDFMNLKGIWAPFSPRGGVPSGVAHGLLWVLQGLGFMALHIALISKMGWAITDNFWFRRDPYKSLPLLTRLGCQVICGFAHQVRCDSR